MTQLQRTTLNLHSLMNNNSKGSIGIQSIMTWLLRATLLQLLCTIGPSYCADPVFTPQTVADSYGNVANNASAITWAPLPKGLPYKTSTDYNDGGLTPWFNFAKHFVNTVQQHDFPYDIVRKIFNGKFDISNDMSEVITYELGFIICLAVGILFVICMPIIGMVFCCCRLCGNCGGEMLQKPSSHQCILKLIYIIVLAVMTFFLSVGMICIYVNNDRVEVAINEVNNNVKTNIDDVNNYITNTVNELHYISLTNFNFTIAVVKRDLNNIGYLVGVPVRDKLGTDAGINTVFSNVLGFTSLVNSVSVSMFAVNTSVSRLKTNGQILANELTRVKGNIDTAKANTTSCIGCNSVDTSSLKMDANFSALPDISHELNKMQDVLSTDLSTTVNNAKKEFEDIPARVTNDSLSTINNVIKLLNDFTTTIDGQVAAVNNLPDGVRNQTSNFEKDFKNFQRDVEKYDQYRWIAGVTLTCTILVIVVLQILGMVLGCLGHKGSALPSERGFLSNCGGILLMAATGFIFIFSWLLMLLTSISFLVGGNVEKLVCEPLTDPDYTVFNQLFDGPNSIIAPNEYLLGNAILQNGSIPLTLSGVLKGCKNNGPAYTVMMLDSLFDLNTATNYRDQIDIATEINNMNVDFSTIQILTPDLQKQLRDFSEAVQLDYNGFRAELGKNTTKVDLLEFATKLDSAAATSSEPSKTDLTTAASDLRTIHNGIYSTVKSDQAKLLADLNTLEANTNTIPGSVNNTLDSVTTAEKFLKANGSDVVKKMATGYANRILDIADSYASNTLNIVKTDIGRCKPLWNLWESMLHISLCKYLTDTFNGFWFSIGFCLFFMVPSIIFNVKLAKHLRRMDVLETYEATNNVSAGKSMFANPSSTINVPTSNLHHHNQQTYASNHCRTDRSKHIAQNNLNQPATNQKEPMHRSNIHTANIANIENRRNSPPVYNTSNNISNTGSSPLLQVPVGPYLEGRYPHKSPYNGNNMHGNVYQYNNAAYAPDSYTDTNPGYDPYPPYQDDVTYSPIGSKYAPGIPPPSYTPEHVKPSLPTAQCPADNYNTEVVYATVNKSKNKTSEYFENNELSKFNPYSEGYDTSKYNPYESNDLSKYDPFGSNEISKNNPSDINSSDKYEQNGASNNKYEYSETQVLGVDNGNQYYKNGDEKDSSQTLNVVQNGSSQNSPLGTMVQNSPVNTLVQPKSILKNKVTFILPEETGTL